MYTYISIYGRFTLCCMLYYIIRKDYVAQLCGFPNASGSQQRTLSVQI